MWLRSYGLAIIQIWHMFGIELGRWFFRRSYYKIYLILLLGKGFLSNFLRGKRVAMSLR